MYYKAGHIELDSVRHTVTSKGKTVCLTPLEYGILAYLMAHPNRVCSRLELFDNVWGQRFMYDTGTLDVHLNALRRKLSLARGETIESVRGAGLILRTETQGKTNSLNIQQFISEWLHSHMGDFERKSLIPSMRLDPFVSELTMTEQELRNMLDGILAALLPSAQPGTIQISSRLAVDYFSLTMKINNTVNELKIPVVCLRCTWILTRF